MTTGTGLDAQVGYKLESTVGTEVTVDKFIEFNSEGFEFNPGWIEPEGLRVGSKFKRGARLVQSRKMVSGSLEMNYATRNMGALWSLCLGSTETPTLLTDGYQQVHQVGDLVGTSATFQVGRPEPESPFTVRPHTYRGCKATSWTFSVSDNEVAKLSIELDGWDEATGTALAAASYPSSPLAEEFNFSQVDQFELGGTIGGADPLTWSGGTAVAAVVTSFNLTGNNALATERFGLGNAGVKKEQLENGIPTITGTLEAEYAQSEFYTPFKANTDTSLLLHFTGSSLGTDDNELEFILPQIRIKKVTPAVSGPDIVKATVEFEVYDDETNAPLQVRLVSADSTIA